MASTDLTESTQASAIPTAHLSPESTPSALEAAQAAPLKQGNTVSKVPKPRRFRRALRATGSVITSVLTAIWICLVYGIPGLFILVGVIVPVFALSFALAAANGAVTVLAGNGILRAAHHSHYSTNAVAAYIGAVGGTIATLIMGFISQFFPHDEHGNVWWPFSLVSSVVAGTLTGTIGCAILQKNHVDLHGMDLVHATRAGALGGTILGPALIVAVPVIFAALFILFSPLFIAMKLGLRWVYVRSSESWNDRGTYRSSYCYTYGTCGDDSEIEEELEDVRRHEKRINNALYY